MHPTRTPGWQPRLLPPFAALLLASLAVAAPAAPGADAESDPRVMVSPALRGLAFPIPDDVLQALRKRDFATAAAGLKKIDPNTLPGPHKGDWAFVLSYSLARSGKAADALPYLELIGGADCAPLAWVALTEGEVYRAADKPEEAAKALDRVPADSPAWPIAMVERAEILRDAGRTAEAYEVYQKLVDRPDPAVGAPVALLALAQRLGSGNPDAYPLLRRIWVHYPHSEEAVQATTLLAQYPTQKATWQEVGLRAEHLMDDSDYAGAILETERRLAEVQGDDIDACRLLYVRGRSLYKQNKLTDAATALTGIGERCTKAEGEYGPKAMYLLGQAQFRLNKYTESAATNLQLAELYPTSSFADDGYTQAGFALVEAGDMAGAEKAWTTAADERTAGDTTPEAMFRLAFALYVDHKPDEARVVAGRLGKLPLGGGWVDIAAGRYWEARWALYPNVDDPNTPVDDPKRKQAAIDGWKSLCEELPTSFYSIQAYSRLVEVAPDVAKSIAIRPEGHRKGDLSRPWEVRLSFYDDPHAKTAVDLLRVGLVDEAREEWGAVEKDALLGDEMAWWTELRIASGDWLRVHDEMRKWLTTNPPPTLGADQPEVLRIAYPDRYWTEISEGATGYSYDPRLFHALSREESNFNIKIVSHAGAKGLSQLMPATAKETAGWMKIPYDVAKLDDPAYNAKLGARYLEQMHKQNAGSPYLALASYNAGAGRINSWVTSWGNVPTDEYVERIPIRETRGYVKRVMGSWQTMHWQFDDGDAYPDLSKFNHQAKPQ